MSACARNTDLSDVQAEEPVEPALDSQMQAEIGQALRQVYQGLVDQPVPEELLSLIRELDRRERKT